ncbi:MAG: hypothetical protein ABSG59_04890 [Verrucomicrobiota bacterium]|jgi:hypothetical protein
MRKSGHDELLTDVLGDDRLEALRQASLAGGLDAIRRRRLRRRGIEIAAAVVVPLVVIFAAAFHPQSRPAERTARQSAPPPAAAGASRVDYINERELFALFPNRPIALVGKPGHQQVLFLDELSQQQAQ